MKSVKLKTEKHGKSMKQRTISLKRWNWQTSSTTDKFKKREDRNYLCWQWNGIFFFVDINQIILKSIWKGKRSRIVKTIMITWERSVYTIWRLNIYPIVTKSAWYLVEGWTHRWMKHQGEPRNRPTQIRPTDSD